MFIARYSFVVIMNVCALRSVAHLFLKNSFCMIDGEAKLIDITRNYVEFEDERLRELEKYRQKLLQHAKFYTSEDELVSNPLAIYKTVKHLTVDFDDVKKNMMNNRHNGTTTKVLDTMDRSIPKKHHLQVEIRNLIHMQRMLNLTVTNMMEGRLAPNVTVTPALMLEDCFIIGLVSAEEHDYESSVRWLGTCENYNDDTTITSTLLLSSLFVGNLPLCRSVLNKCIWNDQFNRVLVDLSLKVSRKLGNWQDENEYCQWEGFKTCAGDYIRELTQQKMTCRYNHWNSPFLTIAPLKEEVLSVIPMITIFRETVYDSEIEELKTEVYDKMKPGTINSKKGLVVEYRFFPSHRAHLDNLETKYTNLWHRLKDMTLLKIQEPIQIVHYVPGGFIRVHSDFQDGQTERMGYRKTQAMLYLSDVILGGETIFPSLKLRIQPVKGSVIIWTNVKADGSQEKLTNHAGCPVIYGEKIIGIQWYRMKGQDEWITRPEDEVTLSEETNAFESKITSWI